MLKKKKKVDLRESQVLNLCKMIAEWYITNFSREIILLIQSIAGRIGTFTITCKSFKEYSGRIELFGRGHHRERVKRWKEYKPNFQHIYNMSFASYW